MVDVHRLTPLPVDELVPEILASLKQTPNLVLEAAPGAGKTTRVPAALVGAVRGDVLVLEPRRIAARLAARRVAWELGEEPGETVGYQVRFERVAGPRTRLHFLTEGVLTRRLLTDPELKGVDAVVLDEFHERHLETDLALALLKRLQGRRPELRLVVMSATLDTGPVARFLGGCPVLRSEGRVFELAVEHRPYSAAPLEEQVRAALETVLGDAQAGEVLVFLPGAAEIRRTARACGALAQKHGRLLLPLYGDLPAAEQDRAVAPAERAKIILATNVAESSITIDGVRTVIDSGLARMATFSQWTGLPTLRVGRVSKAAAKQRAGRAARTAPGRVVRLYTEMDFQQRREFELPELERSDLTQMCLALRAMGMARPEELEWLTAPPELAVEQAEELLALLVRTDEEARKLMRLPVHPRLARMIAAADERGVGRAACAAAALLSAGERTEHSDLLEALDEPRSAAAQLQLRHLLRLAKPERGGTHADDDALLQAVLMGFPDRVAQRKTAGQVMLANGTPAEVVGKQGAPELAVVLDAEHRTEKALPQVRLFARVEAEWLVDFFPERVREETVLEWNRQAERVERVSRLLYDKLILEERRGGMPDPELAAALLAEKALEAGIGRFVDAAQMEELAGRLEFAGFEGPKLEARFREFCSGCRSFAELKNAGDGFVAWLEHGLDGGRLGRYAPKTLRLKAGRVAKIHYERGKTPWIESRLQDFFGMKETPRLGPREVPAVLHLLAPNHRPVQTTTDLAGFWARLYPQVRRELMRRYPRHAWPEDPHAE
ncbi:MAG: ATP-dependent helicase C-terminal domain-containing protein [Terracidiphilus sp.]|nr:ATP-dependent helicase C-terminal domain-containing protein [Terracidiphilus sp.]